VSAVDEARFVENVSAYNVAMNAFVMVDDDAENSVVEALVMTARVIVEVPVVMVLPKVAPLAERFVVEALVVDALMP